MQMSVGIQMGMRRGRRRFWRRVWTWGEGGYEFGDRDGHRDGQRGEDPWARQAFKCDSYMYVPKNPEPIKGRGQLLA